MAMQDTFNMNGCVQCSLLINEPGREHGLITTSRFNAAVTKCLEIKVYFVHLF